MSRVVRLTSHVLRLTSPDHVGRQRGLLLAAPLIELGIGVRNRLGEIEAEAHEDPADGGGIALDLHEVADRRLIQRDRAFLEAPLLAALLVPKTAREAEALENLVRLATVGDLDLALLAGLDAVLE